MNEDDIVFWTKDKKQLKLILGMPTDQTYNKRWARITESKHPKYRRGMIFIVDMNEVILEPHPPSRLCMCKDCKPSFED